MQFFLLAHSSVASREQSSKRRKEWAAVGRWVCSLCAGAAAAAGGQAGTSFALCKALSCCCRRRQIEKEKRMFLGKLRMLLTAVTGAWFRGLLYLTVR